VPGGNRARPDGHHEAGCARTSCDADSEEDTSLRDPGFRSRHSGLRAVPHESRGWGIDPGLRELRPRVLDRGPALSKVGVALGLGCLVPLCVEECAVPLDGESTPREPVRWLLVERRYGDVVPTAASGDGTVNPEAVVLAFQPLYPEDLAWEAAVDGEEHFVEVVGFTPPSLARPGEVVTATGRVGKAKPGELYRLSARASRADVRILGEPEVVVKGSEPAVFRFTSCASGRAGIAVGVERIGP
jgi:hypothetical protein